MMLLRSRTCPTSCSYKVVAAIGGVLLVGVLACVQADPWRTGHHSTEPSANDLDVAELMRYLHQVKPCPEASDPSPYGEEAWSRLIRVARLFQQADPTMVEIALQSYVTHYATSFKEEDDFIAEWSKPFLVLRVMFDLPEDDGVDGYISQGWVTGGFCFAGRPDFAAVPVTLAMPLQWDEGPPAITAGIAAYNGPDYPAGREYRFFLDHFRLRDLCVDKKHMH